MAHPTPSVLLAVFAIPALFAQVESRPASPGPDWRVPEARHRVAVPTGALTVDLPAGANWRGVRLLAATGEPVAFSPESLELSGRSVIEADRAFHFAFPRMIRARNGDLLLFYKVAKTHASDPAFIAMRRSRDNGKTWSARQEIHRDPKPDYASTNTVPLLLPTGRILNWLSSYAALKRPTLREPTFWRYSGDDGATWSAPERFDAASTHSTYYVTDAIVTSDGGVLAGAATFPPTFVGNCWATIWKSPDGKQFRQVAELTSPRVNRGDEVALLETAPGRILCLLRPRHAADNPLRTGLCRFQSLDGGLTWKEEANLLPQLGCTLQRPFLTRLDARTVLLSGRDSNRKLVVAYVSRDNGETFGERRVIDSYNGDGAYTAAVPLDRDTVLFTYYSDVDTEPRKPAIYTVHVKVLPEARRLRLESAAPRSFLYY